MHSPHSDARRCNMLQRRCTTDRANLTTRPFMSDASSNPTDRAEPSDPTDPTEEGRSTTPVPDHPDADEYPDRALRDVLDAMLDANPNVCPLCGGRIGGTTAPHYAGECDECGTKVVDKADDDRDLAVALRTSPLRRMKRRLRRLEQSDALENPTDHDNE